MAEKISGSLKKPASLQSGTILSTAITGVPPTLRRFWGFAKDMAQKFSRHLSKDRSNELLAEVVKEFETDRKI
jgi:hypothetical protein